MSLQRSISGTGRPAPSSKRCLSRFAKGIGMRFAVVPRISSTAAASDRYWAVQAAWYDLGHAIEGMSVLEASAPNNGGPFFAMEYEGTLLTVHKTDSETSPPRLAANRSESSKRNQLYYQTLFDLFDVDIPEVLPESEIEWVMSNLSADVVKRFDLYALITHAPDKAGELPAFVSGIVIDQDNRVLARVDVEEEAKRIAAEDLTELEQAAEILRPEPRRRARGEKASNE
jgi:hypothetical protein